MSALRAAVAPLRPFRRRMALSALLGTLTLLGSAGLLATSGYLIARAAQRPEILSLIVAITAVRGFALVRALSRYFERLVSHDVAFRALAVQRGRVFAGLSKLGPADLPGVAGSDLLTRFVGDVDRLQDLYLRALAPPLVALLAGAATVLAATLLLPVAGLVLAVGLVLGATVAPALAARVAGRAGRRQAGARAALTEALVEGVEGAEELAIAGRELDAVQRVRERSAALVRLQRRDAWAGALATALGGAIAGLTVALVAVVGVAAVQAGDLSGVALAALVLLALVAFEGVTPLSAAARTLRACLDSARRVEEVAAIEPAVVDPADPQPVPAGGDLVARAVTVTFPSQSGHEATTRWSSLGRSGDLNLDHPHGSAPASAAAGAGADRTVGPFDLNLRPGEAVALVGPSGCGKSTLASLLVRFRDPDSGIVTLGGTDVRRLAQHDLRAAVRLAGQDAHLFAASIRANLLLAQPDATDAALEHALHEVGLTGLPLDTLVGEHGAAVSGGQRQRIAAARILLARPRFAVFDEPAAHLDPDGARELHATLAGLARAHGIGVLVITHAPEGLDPFDAVIRLA